MNKGGSSNRASERISQAGKLDPDRTIVLGSDQANTPAHLVVDADGLLDIDRLTATENASVAPAPENDQTPAKPKRNLIAATLDALRIPEKKITKLWEQSSLRLTLQTRFEWYRDHEGESQLRRRLEDVYGGKDKPVTGFVRKNIGVSLIAGAVAIYLTIQYDSRSPNQYRYNEPDSTVSKKVEEEPVKTEQKPNYAHVLNHCVVSDTLRVFYDSTDNVAVKDKVITEVNGFLDVFATSEVEQQYVYGESKQDNTISQVDSVLPTVAQYRDRLADEFITLETERRHLEQRLITFTHAPEQSLSDINRSIKLREQLDEIEARLDEAPSSSPLEALDFQLLRLQRIVAGEHIVSVARISLWAKSMSELDHDALRVAVQKVIENDISDAVTHRAEGAPGVQRYRVQILTATLRHLGDLISQLTHQRNYHEGQFDRKQSASNSKLRKLLDDQGRSNAALLNYSNCLTPPKDAQRKLALR